MKRKEGEKGHGREDGEKGGREIERREKEEKKQ